MKRQTLLIFILFLCVGSCSVTKRTETEKEVYALVKRIMPEHTDKFEFKQVAKEDKNDFFTIENVDGKILISGPDGTSMAAGLNWFLKYRCNSHISFENKQVTLPDPLPSLRKKIRKEIPYKYRYFFNYCTFSYTMAWWDWQQWERMIDWMALNGVNMPLAMVGQEAVVQAVYQELGLSEKEIKDFIVGPAYFPWGWMGNIDGLGGPLPDSWIASHRELQRKILARERRLGMKPVLQGFTGHIPVCLKDKFPGAKIHQTGDWSAGFSGTFFLDPVDPLFQQIGKLFIEKQMEIYGSDHFYAADTFNEMDPPTGDLDFLANMSKTIYRSMQAADSEAVWVMQGWFLYYSPDKFWTPERSRALIEAVPDEKMILLDLFGDQYPIWDKFEAFYGKPWIWNVLHNFGGKIALNGDLPKIRSNLNDVLTSPDKGNFAGIGMMMEGFGNNPIVQDFTMDMIWRRQVPDLGKWVSDFAQRRYGSKDSRVVAVWKTLLATVYRSPVQSGSLLCDRPGLYNKKMPHRSKPFTPYDPIRLAEACRKFLDVSDVLKNTDTYQFDAVNFTRQVLCNYSNTIVKDLSDAYRRKDKKTFEEKRERLLEMIVDLDDLLATRKEYLFGRWIADAVRWATDENERNLYEWNARNIITLWGLKCTEGQFDDLNGYAQKQWSGLFKGYYLPRWQRFLVLLSESLERDETFVRAKYLKEACEWEKDWSHRHEAYPDQPTGDPVRTAKRLFKKYESEIFK